MTNDKQSGGVRIGNVSGSIIESIFVGRDAIITLDGQPTAVNKEPTVEELKQLLVEIYRDLAQITIQQETLKDISLATPFVTKGVEQSVKDVSKKIEETSKMTPEEAKSLQENLAEATTLLSSILDGAKAVADKAIDVGKAVKPIAEKLEPLVEKMGVAVLWVAKLWLDG